MGINDDEVIEVFRIISHFYIDSCIQIKRFVALRETHIPLTLFFIFCRALNRSNTLPSFCVTGFHHVLLDVSPLFFCTCSQSHKVGLCRSKKGWGARGGSGTRMLMLTDEEKGAGEGGGVFEGGGVTRKRERGAGVLRAAAEGKKKTLLSGASNFS